MFLKALIDSAGFVTYLPCRGSDLVRKRTASASYASCKLHEACPSCFIADSRSAWRFYPLSWLGMSILSLCSSYLYCSSIYSYRSSCSRSPQLSPSKTLEEPLLSGTTFTRDTYPTFGDVIFYLTSSSTICWSIRITSLLLIKICAWFIKDFLTFNCWSCIEEFSPFFNKFLPAS